MQPDHKCGAAGVLPCCYRHRQRQDSKSHIVHQVPGITYWCKKSFVRVRSFTYHAPRITYKVKTSNVAPGTGHYLAWFHTVVIDREHSNIHIFCRESSCVVCGGGLFRLKRIHKDMGSTTQHTYYTRYVDMKQHAVGVGNYDLNLMHVPYVCT